MALLPLVLAVLVALGAGALGDAEPLDLDVDEVLRDRNFTFAGPGPAPDGLVQWLQGVYAPARWSAAALAAAPAPCALHLALYRDGLVRGDDWAQKVADASGRYSSQFFFGNDYWLGSLRLCGELSRANATPVALAFVVLQLRLQPDAALQPTPTAAAGAVPVAGPQVGAGARVVSLGACVPAACEPDDLRPVLELGRPAHGPRSLRVLTARRVPGAYRLTSDFKFHVLGGVTAALLLLLAAGTAYDIRQRATRPFDAEGPVIKTLGAGEKDVAPSVGIASRVLLGFSAVSNGHKILQTSTEENLSCIHGLRFISLAWVIMVHTYLNAFAIAENKGLRSVTERNTLFQTVSNATYSVDTFFFISGLLLTFVYFRNKDKGEPKPGPTFFSGTRQFVLLLVYRFTRLTPAYLYVLGIAELSMRWVVSTSVFTPKLADHITCSRYWWRNALYINSLFPKNEMCMLWSWYMANDTQFYILGLILVLFATRYFWLVVASWGVFLVSSWVTTAFISVHYEYIARVQEPFALFDELYDKPWTRVGPYLVGMAIGWYLQRNKCKIHMNRVVATGGWALALACFATLVYSVLHVKMTVIGSAAYMALGHTAWGAALGWVVVASCCGYGGFINKLLSFKAMVPMSRLTYCAYLVHPILMLITTSQMDGPLHLHTSMVLIIFLGNLMMSYTVSFMISLVLEAPLVNILKICMEPRKKAK